VAEFVSGAFVLIHIELWDKFRILIVEDNGLFPQAVREGLEPSFPGVAIEEATNGVEAFRRVSIFPPDLILMGFRPSHDAEGP